MEEKSFRFDIVDKYNPDVVIRNTISEIEKATKGLIIAHIGRYEGEISSYYKNIASSLSAVMGGKELVDIQKELGDVNKEKNKFEVYLTVKGLDYYKYRMMFLQYGTIAYPVKVVMNYSLARAYSDKSTDTFVFETMEEMEIMIRNVIESEYFIKLLQSLINESIRRTDYLSENVYDESDE